MPFTTYVFPDHLANCLLFLSPTFNILPSPFLWDLIWQEYSAEWFDRLHGRFGCLEGKWSVDHLLAFEPKIDDVPQVSQRSDSPDFLSFGWQRAELLGAFFNGCFLLALGVSIALQSIDRFVYLESTNLPALGLSKLNIFFCRSQES